MATLSPRQRQVLGLDEGGAAESAFAPGRDAARHGELPELAQQPRSDTVPLLSPPGSLGLARWRPSRRAVLGALACLMAILAVIGVRTWWTRHQAAEPPRAVAVDPAERGGGSREAAHTSAGRGRAPRAPGATSASGEASAGGRPVQAQPGSVASTEPDMLVVHVSGQVARPGIVRVPRGARVTDAIAAAGGARPSAALAEVNLARPAVDGEQIHVPADGEPGRAQAAAPPPARPGARGQEALSSAGAAAQVNLNSADAAALDQLPGIGPALAQRIVDHRGTHGPFRAVEDLDQVPGIGPALLDRLRPRCRV